MAFDYSLAFDKINFRECPYLYRVGIGEQGVLLVEPYKSELFPHWKFKTPNDARQSAAALIRSFEAYLSEEDFVGMDMARKFLQMGFTRSRRYANHRSGKKYNGEMPKNLKGKSGSHGRPILPLDKDGAKAESAAIFKAVWEEVELCKPYRDLKAEWKLWYG